MTTYRQCLRCNDRFERISPDQIHCIPCSTEVATIVAADARRAVVRFPRASDRTDYGRAA